jgi:hypothetical protein
MAGRAMDPRKPRSRRSQRARLTRLATVPQPKMSGEVRALRRGDGKTSASHHMSHARKSGELGRGRLQRNGEQQTRAGRQEPQSAAVLRAVGRAHSTDLEEVGEVAGNARRVDGGKGRGQRKICFTKRDPDSVLDHRAHVPGADRTESEREVFGLANAS